ncbi:MAG: ExbD/TolR family protein [Sedimentisphaeraceae bacterium JB056]
MSEFSQQSIRAKIIERLKTRSNSIKFNMTPMIDIVFLLLVFFLATARFRPLESKLPLQLPAPQGGQLASFSLVEPLTINIDSQGQGLMITIEGTEFAYQNADPASFINFGEQLADIYESQKRNTADPVELDCGAELSWEHLVKFYNLMYGMGITNITFVTD